MSDKGHKNINMDYEKGGSGKRVQETDQKRKRVNNTLSESKSNRNLVGFFI